MAGCHWIEGGPGGDWRASEGLLEDDQLSLAQILTKLDAANLCFLTKLILTKIQKQPKKQTDKTIKEGRQGDKQSNLKIDIFDIVILIQDAADPLLLIKVQLRMMIHVL